VTAQITRRDSVHSRKIVLHTVFALRPFCGPLGLGSPRVRHREFGECALNPQRDLEVTRRHRRCFHISPFISTSTWFQSTLAKQIRDFFHSRNELVAYRRYLSAVQDQLGPVGLKSIVNCTEEVLCHVCGMRYVEPKNTHSMWCGET